MHAGAGVRGERGGGVAQRALDLALYLDAVQVAPRHGAAALKEDGHVGHLVRVRVKGEGKGKGLGVGLGLRFGLGPGLGLGSGFGLRAGLG